MDILKPDDWVAKAESYLNTLCDVKPNRRTGSAGNREAAIFLANTLHSFGYNIETNPFDCLDYTHGEVRLVHADDTYEAHISRC